MSGPAYPVYSRFVKSLDPAGGGGGGGSSGGGGTGGGTFHGNEKAPGGLDIPRAFWFLLSQ